MLLLHITKEKPSGRRNSGYAQSFAGLLTGRNSNDFEIQRLNKFIVETVGTTNEIQPYSIF